MRRLTVILITLLAAASLAADAPYVLASDAINADYDAGLISRYEQLLYLTQFVKAQDQLPEAYQPYLAVDEPLISGTPILAYVQDHLDELPTLQAQEIQNLILARPTSIGSVESSMYPVKMHYYQSSQIGEATTMLGYIEHSWGIETTDGGDSNRLWPPPPDYNFGGDNDYDFYYENTSGGIMGYCAGEMRYSPITDRYCYTSYIVIDIDMASSANKSTVCHELAHAVQFGADFAEFRMREAGAVYHEDVVYPGMGHDYSITGMFQSKPWRTIVNTGDLFEYGAWIWYKFLEVNYFDSDGYWYDDMLRDSVQPTNYNQPSVFGVLEDMLAGKGTNIIDAFTEFCVWRLFCGAAHDDYHWPDAIGQQVYIDPVNRHIDYPVTDGAPKAGQEPQKMGMNGVYFKTNDDHETLLITFDGRDDRIYKVKVVGYREGASVESDVFTMDVDNEYSYGQLTIPDWSPYDGVYMIICFYNLGNMDPDDPDSDYWTGKGDYTYTAHLSEMDAEVADLDAVHREEGVLLSWSAAGDIVGYNVYRDQARLNDTLLPADAAAYLDTEADSGSYVLGALTSDGEEVVFGPVKVDPAPRRGVVALEQNFPNPSAGETTLSFELAEAGAVRLAVYDISGRLIEVVADETLGSGRHSYTWNGADNPSGVYIYRLETSGEVLTRRLVISR